MKSVKRRPFGLWDSPISAQARAGRTRWMDVRWDERTGDLAWLERGAQDTRLMARMADGTRLALTDSYEISGGEAYGGGEFDLLGGTVIFVERGRQLHRLEMNGGATRPITPPFDGAASPAISPDGRWVVFVASRGEDCGLYLVDSHGAQPPVNLARGADFYMDPVWHPQGMRLAWMEWDHPDMPWDGARIRLADLAGDPPSIVRSSVVLGGADSPASQPAFSPDGRWLSCLAGDGEWDQLALISLEHGGRRALVRGEGVVLAPPAWVQGIRTYGWRGDSQRIDYLRNQEGVSGLFSVDLNGRSQPASLGAFSWAAQMAVSPLDGQIALIASGPAQPPCLARLGSHGLSIEGGSGIEEVPAAYFSVAQPLRWPAEDGAVIHGLYYPPTNPDFAWQGLPPAVIRVHSGPTMQAVAEFNEEAQYFTSRGYAWLELNYRGSTGYGRSYRRALNGRWGELDVLDTVSAADGLAAAGLADGRRLALYGSSAGGYTVLNTLIRHPGKFRAGIDAYGVSNLFKLDEDTHKFERYANARLIGPLPQAGQKYRDWSPEFHADAIRDPLAIFQGEDDPVVPRSQSDAIAAALQRNGIPHLYRVYPGEGHRFRKSETRLDFILSMEQFLAEYVLPEK